MRHSGLIMFITIDSVCLFDKAGVCGLKIQFRFQFQYQYQDRVVTIRILLSLTFEGFLARLTLISLFNKMSFVFTLIVFEMNFFFVHIVSFRCFFEQFHNSIELKKSHPTSKVIELWNRRNQILKSSVVFNTEIYKMKLPHNYIWLRFFSHFAHCWWILTIIGHKLDIFDVLDSR